MKFIDEAEIYVRAGDGGRGCISFRREKFVPRGGPNGGDGGKGGDIIIRTSHSRRTLLDLKYRKHHLARHGGHGEGSNRTGRNSPDVEIVVPVGTVVKDAGTGEVLADLILDGERFIVAKGGIGGRGNARFATPTNQAPRYAQGGIKGEERRLKLELKLLADVGIIGLPNVGKSSFIAKVSAAKPKISDYPFTTLAPNLGVVRYGELESFVIADIPGLIEGAHEGMGMGARFLRHIERTSVLLHILDISGEAPGGAWRDFELINRELSLFSPTLVEKPQIVAINKIDLPLTMERIKREIASFKEKGIKALPFSALTGEGIGNVIGEIVKKLHQTKIC
ncbi:MAG: GTPase ObgE [Syntrophaceae bacterium CG2_30_49_12]|nr:MAG: GTPase ObgE [Syntrophaceae bacterium CG2_30_49_12]PIP05889.1 MAG: GTPase ObgE [Syntrophobacterales bacterium CG23_combo_of_CG06-09_8_20_14_all_48_27]PJA49457.1 MAG: GTPase ObgE [Syntrophobacterales bacterium CG_4_9_14_3_um_filter_49_8]PJC73321.1 MAG: GTPase ObgE [Syntrophobacterales bacterium CG_4_8_14_3_um_filter_49_14]